MENKYTIAFSWKNKPLAVQEAADYMLKIIGKIQELPFFDGVKANYLPLKGNIYMPIEKDIENEVYINELSKIFMKHNVKNIRYHTKQEPTINSLCSIGFRNSFQLLSSGDLQLNVGTDGFLYDSIQLDLPTDVFEFNKIYDSFTYLLDFLIHVFDIEHGVVLPKFSKLKLKGNEYRPGWLNYIRKDIQLPPLPPDFEVLEYQDKGMIVIATREQFSIYNEAHYVQMLQLQQIYIDNGIEYKYDYNK